MTRRAIYLLMLLAPQMPVALLAQGQSPPSLLSIDQDCRQLNELVKARVAVGELKEAETLLNSVSNRISDEPQTACAGVILNNLAAVNLNSGRFVEAEKLARQAVNTLGKIGPADQVSLLRPLQILSVAQLQQGEISSARQTLKRTQLIRSEDPHDRALVHATAAMILVREGKDADAEPEYLAAVTALEKVGLRQTADAAVVMENLGGLYTRQKRFEDARQAFERASATFSAAKDTVPVDLIGFLNLRAALHCNLAEWPEAEADLSRAIELASHEPRLDSIILETLFRSYAKVLRNTHRRREAHTFEAKASALQAPTAGIVDVTGLLKAK